MLRANCKECLECNTSANKRQYAYIMNINFKNTIEFVAECQTAQHEPQPTYSLKLAVISNVICCTANKLYYKFIRLHR